jgi:hypothetical protein
MATQDDALMATPGFRREFLTFLKVSSPSFREAADVSQKLTSKQNIRAFKGDLAAFNAPAFLLSPTSMTEFPTYWAEQLSLFMAPASEEEPAQRSLAVLQWYICTLKQQYGKRQGKKRKPLNPFLGELFLGHFQEDATGRTELVAEQVSHHPPVTAYHIWNENHGVHMDGYNAQKTYFSGTLRIDKIGFVLLHLDKFNEDYLITLPNMHAVGLFPPPPYPELEGTTYIQSSSGYTSEIDYSGKGWLKGKKNSFRAILYKTGESDKPLNVLEGQWQHGSFDIKAMPSKKIIDTTSTESFPLTPLIVASIEEQDPLESRRAWYKVAQAIEKGDMHTVSTEKSRIEEEQRAMRKVEKIEGTEWPTRYFTKVDSWPILEDLVKQIGVDLQLEATKGMWKWDEEKNAKIKGSA